MFWTICIFFGGGDTRSLAGGLRSHSVTMRTTSLPLGEAPTPVKQVAHKGQDKSCQKGKNKPEERLESKNRKKTVCQLPKSGQQVHLKNICRCCRIRPSGRAQGLPDRKSSCKRSSEFPATTAHLCFASLQGYWLNLILGALKIESKNNK